jgi:homoserine O-acetyltransferase
MSEASVLTKKEFFLIPVFRTESGAEIRDAKIGYETYGKMNKNADNVVLHCPFLTGNSHIAGIYSSEDREPGWCDSMIGPGKPLDTSRFFIISTDSFCARRDAITTGPSTIDPETGNPYGRSFPQITHRDQARMQKFLLDQLGVKGLQLVFGTSMGGSIALEWAALYPEMVKRVLPIVSRGLRTPGIIVAFYDMVAEAIMSDPNWCNGDYYGKQEPVRGVIQAMRMMTHLGQSYGWCEAMGGREWADGSRDPIASWSNQFKVRSNIDRIAEMKTSRIDANSFLNLIRAEQLFAIDERGGSVSSIRAPVLFICEGADTFAPIAGVASAVQQLRAQGVQARMVDLKTGKGHYCLPGDMELINRLIGEFVNEHHEVTA